MYISNLKTYILQRFRKTFAEIERVVKKYYGIGLCLDNVIDFTEIDRELYAITIIEINTECNLNSNKNNVRINWDFDTNRHAVSIKSGGICYEDDYAYVSRLIENFIHDTLLPTIKEVIGLDDENHQLSHKNGKTENFWSLEFGGITLSLNWSDEGYIITLFQTDL